MPGRCHDDRMQQPDIGDVLCQGVDVTQFAAMACADLDLGNEARCPAHRSHQSGAVTGSVVSRCRGSASGANSRWPSISGVSNSGVWRWIASRQASLNIEAGRPLSHETRAFHSLCRQAVAVAVSAARPTVCRPA